MALSLPVTFTLVFLVSFFGGVIQTVAGLGYVMLAMAIFPLLLPISQSLVLAQLGGALMSLWVIWGKFRQINWREVLLPVLFATLGSLAGLLFLGGLSTKAYMRALGILLVALALWMWKLSARFSIKRGPVSGGICGGIAGLMGALFGVSVPPLVLYYSSGMDSKDSYMVPLQISLAIQTGVCLICRAPLGMWPADVWPLAPAVILGLVLGKFPGRFIYGRLNVDTLRDVIYVMVAILGLYTFFSN